MSIHFIIPSVLQFYGKGKGVKGERKPSVHMEGRKGFARIPLTMRGLWQWFLHALLLCVLGTVRAIKEFSLEQLNSDDSKDEHEEFVDNEDVEDILQGGHHAVKHSLWTAATALMSFL